MKLNSLLWNSKIQTVPVGPFSVLLRPHPQITCLNSTASGELFWMNRQYRHRDWALLGLLNNVCKHDYSEQRNLWYLMNAQIWLAVSCHSYMQVYYGKTTTTTKTTMLKSLKVPNLLTAAGMWEELCQKVWCGTRV